LASNLKDTSQYLLTPVTDFYLDLWVPRTVPASDYDTVITIPANMDKRPDLLSQQQYGTPRLWWVFAVRNPDILLDPIGDFTAGVEIYVPVNILAQ
jgi:hypothetical protein